MIIVSDTTPLSRRILKIVRIRMSRILGFIGCGFKLLFLGFKNL
jgi:hypothetical protein